MNQSKHIPGPWKLSTQLESEHVKTLPGICSADGVHITDVSGYGNTREKNFANATLIAAAPELLGACQLLVSAFDMCGKFTDPYFNLAKQEALAAISKATSR